MNNRWRQVNPVAASLYKLEQIRRLEAGDDHFRLEKPLHGLLMIKEAEGTAVIDGVSYSLHPHKIMFLPPGAEVRLSVASDRKADNYEIRFYALQAEDRDHFAAAALDCPVECFPPYFPFLIGKAEEMLKKHHSLNVWDRMRANLIFQEMIISIFEEPSPDYKTDLNHVIKLTQEYMDKYYRTPITRDKLAEMSGLSEDYYSREFKKRVGQSPMEYLTAIRMNRAKQLLLYSGMSFRSIAHSVGLSDEFYFSRKFKSVVGCSPIAYVKRFKSAGKIASLNHLTTGHFIALNMEPYAAVMNNAYPVASRLRHTISVGRAQPDLEKLISIKPDLIVAQGTRDEERSPKTKLFHQIAPTITLHFNEDWRAHFRTIAKIVGKEQEAEDWLSGYARKAEAVRERIKNAVGEETFLFVGIGEGTICVYGQRNLGAVLYGDLQLAMPPGVREIAHYKEVSLDELAGFDADRIVLTTFRHNGTPEMDRIVEQAVAALSAHPKWQALPAVKNHKVHAIYESRHLYTSYNALSHDLLLDKAQELFVSSSGR